MPDLASAQDALGTVHFSRFMVEGDERFLFLSDIDGEVDQPASRAFIDGAAQRAELIGDTGASAPRNWIAGFGRNDDTS